MRLGDPVLEEPQLPQAAQPREGLRAHVRQALVPHEVERGQGLAASERPRGQGRQPAPTQFELREPAAPLQPARVQRGDPQVVQVQPREPPHRLAQPARQPPQLREPVQLQVFEGPHARERPRRELRQARALGDGELLQGPREPREVVRTPGRWAPHPAQPQPPHRRPRQQPGQAREVHQVHGLQVRRVVEEPLVQREGARLALRPVPNDQALEAREAPEQARPQPATARPPAQVQRAAAPRGKVPQRVAVAQVDLAGAPPAEGTPWRVRSGAGSPGLGSSSPHRGFGAASRLPAAPDARGSGPALDGALAACDPGPVVPHPRPARAGDDFLFYFLFFLEEGKGGWCCCCCFPLTKQ